MRHKKMHKYNCKVFKDWTKLTATGKNGKVRFFDVMILYKNLILEISDKTKTPYRVVQASMKHINKPFIEYTTSIFKERKEYSKDSFEIKQLQSLLNIPIMEEL